eukprot:1099100-Pelagomonas_calceolata.AAC.4
MAGWFNVRDKCESAGSPTLFYCTCFEVYELRRKYKDQSIDHFKPLHTFAQLPNTDSIPFLASFHILTDFENWFRFLMLDENVSTATDQPDSRAVGRPTCNPKQTMKLAPHSRQWNFLRAQIITSGCACKWFGEVRRAVRGLESQWWVPAGQKGANSLVWGPGPLVQGFQGWVGKSWNAPRIHAQAKLSIHLAYWYATDVLGILSSKP